MLVDKSKYFAQMKVDFLVVSDRLHTFYIKIQEKEKETDRQRQSEREEGKFFDFENHTEFVVLDVWCNSFKEYIHHDMNKV